MAACRSDRNTTSCRLFPGVRLRDDFRPCAGHLSGGARARITYRPLFYAHVVLLQITLLIRLGGDVGRVGAGTAGRWPAECRHAGPVPCEYGHGALGSLPDRLAPQCARSPNGAMVRDAVASKQQGCVGTMENRGSRRQIRRVMDALRQVVDPRLGSTSSTWGWSMAGGSVMDKVHVTMTMTTPACQWKSC